MTAVTKCILCFNDLEEESVPCYTPKLPELCCKYLYSSLTEDTLLCQSNHYNLPFCPKCFESVVELGDLNEQLEFYQKRISEFVFILSLEILLRRGHSSSDHIGSNYRNSERNLIAFDVSTLPNCDFKSNTVVISAEIETSTQGDHNFNSEDVGERFKDPLFIPSTPDPKASVEVTLEEIKVYSDEHSRINDESHDEINTAEDIDTDFSIEQADQSFSTSQPRNKRLIPIIKLQRLSFQSKNQVILVENDQTILNRSKENGGMKSQTVWTKSDFGGSFKITKITNISAFEDCFEKSPQIPGMSAITSNENSSFNRQISEKKENTGVTKISVTSTSHLIKQNYHLNQFISKTFQCNDTLQTKQELEVHAAIPSNALQYKSDVGTKIVKTKRCTLKHKVMHSGEQPHKCGVCKSRFKIKRNLQSHKMLHWKERPFKCEICGKGFCFKYLLITHRRLHTGERPYKCEVCGKRFRRKDYLKRHANIHTVEKSYTCEFCGEKFRQPNILITHRRIHTGERPYNCKICGKRFTQHSNLARHSKIHTGERPYKCEFCGKGFRQRSTLARHSNIHTGEGHFTISAIFVAREFSVKQL